MTYTLVSLALFVLAVLFLAAVVLMPLAGNVLHVWGTDSAGELASEALRRVFAGNIRCRLTRSVNAQREIAVDGSRRTCTHVAVSISTADVQALVGPDGDLARVAVDAARGYARYALANDMTCDAAPRVVILPEEWIRRGRVKARWVAGKEFAELWREMLTWNQDRDELGLLPAGMQDLESGPELLTEVNMTAVVGRSDAPTEMSDPVCAPATPSAAPRLVLTDTHGARHLVSAESVIIGRAHECGVRFDSPEVSREHVDLYFQEGTWWLRDRGSRNGTIVDGQQVRGTGPVRLRAGGLVVLGSDAAGERLTIAGVGEL